MTAPRVWMSSIRLTVLMTIMGEIHLIIVIIFGLVFLMLLLAVVVALAVLGLESVCPTNVKTPLWVDHVSSSVWENARHIMGRAAAAAAAKGRKRWQPLLVISPLPVYPRCFLHQCNRGEDCRIVPSTPRRKTAQRTGALGSRGIVWLFPLPVQ